MICRNTCAVSNSSQLNQSDRILVAPSSTTPATSGQQSSWQAEMRNDKKVGKRTTGSRFCLGPWSKLKGQCAPCHSPVGQVFCMHLRGVTRDRQKNARGPHGSQRFSWGAIKDMTMNCLENIPKQGTKCHRLRAATKNCEWELRQEEELEIDVKIEELMRPQVFRQEGK